MNGTEEPHEVAVDEVAVDAISDVADALGVSVDAVLVAKLAGMLVGVLMGDSWAAAARAGLERASAVKDAATAEAAAVKRNAP